MEIPPLGSPGSALNTVAFSEAMATRTQHLLQQLRRQAHRTVHGRSRARQQQRTRRTKSFAEAGRSSYSSGARCAQLASIAVGQPWGDEPSTRHGGHGLSSSGQPMAFHGIPKSGPA